MNDLYQWRIDLCLLRSPGEESSICRAGDLRFKRKQDNELNQKKKNKRKKARAHGKEREGERERGDFESMEITEHGEIIEGSCRKEN